jgi:uncharacterized membrane protein YtjA (UPF0391 family)
MGIAIPSDVMDRNSRSYLLLVLGLIAGVVGFGDRYFNSPRLLDLSGFVPAPLEGLLIWLSRILFVPLMVFFVVSLWFGRHLHNRQY